VSHAGQASGVERSCEAVAAQGARVDGPVKDLALRSGQ
jgi:hypothetical protein